MKIDMVCLIYTCINVSDAERFSKMESNTTQSKKCFKCDGTGKMRCSDDFDLSLYTCYFCDGTGILIQERLDTAKKYYEEHRNK